MSKLKQVRQAQVIGQAEVAHELRAAGINGYDVPLLSKIEHDICLPTPRALGQLCKILNCSTADLYCDKELDFALADKQTKISPSEGLEGKESTKERKVQFRQDEYSLQILCEEVLRACGYKNKTEWFRECVRQLEAKYLEHIKTALVGGTTKAAGEHIA